MDARGTSLLDFLIMRFDSIEACAFISFILNLMRREVLVINWASRSCNGTTDVVQDIFPCVFGQAISVVLRKDVLLFQLSICIFYGLWTVHGLIQCLCVVIVQCWCKSKVLVYVLRQ